MKNIFTEKDGYTKNIMHMSIHSTIKIYAYSESYKEAIKLICLALR